MCVQKRKERLACLCREVNASPVDDKEFSSGKTSTIHQPLNDFGEVAACVGASSQVEVEGVAVVGERGDKSDVDPQAQRSALKYHRALAFWAPDLLGDVI